MYHLIDEKRRLYACNVAEITLEDSYCILQSWGGKHSLSEVLVFYSVTRCRSSSFLRHSSMALSWVKGLNGQGGQSKCTIQLI